MTIDNGHSGSIRERIKEEKQRKLFIVRNILNTLFILIAIVGLVWYFAADKNVGLIIIVCSIPLKMTSTVLRLMKP